MRMLLPLCGALVMIASARAAVNEVPAAEDAMQERIARSTVTVLPSRCAGVVVEDGWHVATVDHCVQGERATVVLDGGQRAAGEVVLRDRARDHVLLRIDTEAEPLPLAPDLPEVGEELHFVGRSWRPTPPQEVRVERIAPCPSLPGAREGAIFSTLDAAPGDSGTPLVDGDGAVTGLVHGGARCEIATPAAPLKRAFVRVQPAVL